MKSLSWCHIMHGTEGDKISPRDHPAAETTGCLQYETVCRYLHIRCSIIAEPRTVYFGDAVPGDTTKHALERGGGRASNKQLQMNNRDNPRNSAGDRSSGGLLYWLMYVPAGSW